MKYLNDNKEKYRLKSILICGFSLEAHALVVVSVFSKDKPLSMILVYHPVSEPCGFDIFAYVYCKTLRAFIVCSYCDKTESAIIYTRDTNLDQIKFIKLKRSYRYENFIKFTGKEKI